VSRQEALALLMRGVGQDLRDYRRLKAMLEEQFMAALRHQTALLKELAERVTTTVEVLELRRRERVALVGHIVGAGAPMSAAFALLSGSERSAVESGWKMLDALVNECKQLNSRNGRLIMDQHGIMQRVLHGEEQTYAPA
jgi:flagella synthesis protein FlgN